MRLGPTLRVGLVRLIVPAGPDLLDKGSCPLQDGPATGPCWGAQTTRPPQRCSHQPRKPTSQILGPGPTPLPGENGRRRRKESDASPRTCQCAKGSQTQRRAHGCPATAPSGPQGQPGQMREECTFFLESCLLGLFYNGDPTHAASCEQQSQSLGVPLVQTPQNSGAGCQTPQ